PVVRVGIGCFVTKRVDDTLYFLLGQRKGSHGSGTWALPGGHLEMGESWASCTQREVEEECGIRISLDQVHIATNNIVFNANKHYVDIVMASTGPFTGTVTLMEPEKCERWVWVTWQEVVD
ncbi:NUDIX hydrolase domain-like protein, partial [Coemansia spiralis]